MRVGRRPRGQRRGARVGRSVRFPVSCTVERVAWAESYLLMYAPLGPRDASPEKTDQYCRLTRFSHGCEPPFSQRYGEAATSTTKGRGARTQALYPGLCIHLTTDWIWLFYQLKERVRARTIFCSKRRERFVMPRRRKPTYTAVKTGFRTVPSYHFPNVTAKESQVQRRDGE